MTIMRMLAGGLLWAFLWSGGAAAQVPPTYKLCDGTVAGCPLIGANNPLATTGGGGGGGGGLSVVDRATWTQGTSPFTPSGGVFNDSATLTSGQQGTLRLTTDRQLKVLDSAVLAAVNGPIPAGTNSIGSVVTPSFPTTVDTNSGNKSGSTLRFVLATDQPNLTAPLNVQSVPSYGAAQLSHQVLSFSASGNNIAITRAVGTIKVYQLVLSCAAAAIVTPQDGTSTSLGANTATQYISLGIQGEPIFTTTGTNNFVINLSAGTSCTGFAKYRDS